MTIISVQNERSRLVASDDIVKAVRPLISYRAQELPPVAVQLVIKAFMKSRRSHGAENDVFRMYGDAETRQKLLDLDWPEERMTPALMKATSLQRGVWDGWRSLVSPGGYFGTGLVRHVERALSLHIGVPVRVDDYRERPQIGMRYAARQPIPLFPFQSEAIEAFFDAGGRGVINIPPRGGKTRIAIEITARLNIPTLVVVPTKNLVSQTVERFRSWLPADQVQGVTGGRPSPRKQRQLNNALVWIATPATAAGPKPAGSNNNVAREGMQGIASRQLLIIDEFHHSAADTWQDISLAARSAYFRLGLTGTHYRADGRDLAMHAVLSSCVYRRSVADMIALGRLVPARIAMVRVTPRPKDTMVGGHDVYPECVIEHPERNRVLVDAAHGLVANGKRVLVMVKEVRHAETLCTLIRDRGINAIAVRGGEGSEEAEQALKDLQTGRVQCVIGTPVIGEGVDVPAADALVYAAGGQSRVKVVQDYFRVLTASPGKTHGIIVDMADQHHPVLVEAAARRLALYRAESAFSAEVINPENLYHWLQAA